ASQAGSRVFVWQITVRQIFMGYEPCGSISRGLQYSQHLSSTQRCNTSSVRQPDSMESTAPNTELSSVAASSSPTPGQGMNLTNAEPPSERQNAKSPRMERPLAEIISEQFPPFDAESLIVNPFQDEAGRDAKFEEELSARLLNAILMTHAWAASRPKHEAMIESRKLEDEISQIMETERQQGMCTPTPSSSSFYRVGIVGMLASFCTGHTSSPCSSRPLYAELGSYSLLSFQTREKLGEFVRRMKTALAALIGTPF
ncbi:hypothetical protein BDZ97DRAFT_1834167, partial [Flammula alnicola]